MIYSFALVVEGVDLTGVDSRHPDDLYEAGCDDTALTSEGGLQRAIFDREAGSFAAAVASAIAAVEGAVPGSRVLTVQRLDQAATGTSLATSTP